MNYEGPFWIFIGESGMPNCVEKCTFRPTILPFPKGEWHEVWIRNSKKEQLETQIRGHMEAMRPLLDEWSKNG